MVSDLHMSAGRDPLDGRLSRSEDFHLDRAFTRFLEWRQRAGREHGRPWRLVILGDFLDFTRVELGAAGEDRRRLDVGTEAALAKLERLAAGHPEVFAALRSLVGGGIPLQLIPGNHDLNNVTRLLCWSQRSTRELPLGSSLPEYLYALMDAADPGQIPLEPSLARVAAAARRWLAAWDDDRGRCEPLSDNGASRQQGKRRP